MSEIRLAMSGGPYRSSNSSIGTSLQEPHDARASAEAAAGERLLEGLPPRQTREDAFDLRAARRARTRGAPGEAGAGAPGARLEVEEDGLRLVVARVSRRDERPGAPPARRREESRVARRARRGLEAAQARDRDLDERERDAEARRQGARGLRVPLAGLSPEPVRDV